jgi:DNA-binding transcriptional ArsR family regulator
LFDPTMVQRKSSAIASTKGREFGLRQRGEDVLQQLLVRGRSWCSSSRDDSMACAASFFQSIDSMIYIHTMNLASLDLNLLVALDALVSEAHVGRAAARVGLSQPAMSHALARLRDLMGDALLVRSRARHGSSRRGRRRCVRRSRRRSMRCAGCSSPEASIPRRTRAASC